jgi:FKBP12-rapamycin complex-associated protein
LLIRESDEAETALNKAWNIYRTIFRRIDNQLPELTKLELQHCCPALSKARNLELSVPGSYRVDGSYVKILQFIPNVQVINSKQRPRKITLRGSGGQNYVFLLKVHEDLRQDERVMQLFGLVSALLARDRQTKKNYLSIQICDLPIIPQLWCSRLGATLRYSSQSHFRLPRERKEDSGQHGIS